MQGSKKLDRQTPSKGSANSAGNDGADSRSLVTVELRAAVGWVWVS